MDFATLKAYMTNTSIKENANSTTVCAQRRLNVSKIERQSNRNMRLTQFRNIPENMSAYNTPQSTRIAVPFEAPKPATSNATKLFQDKQNLRQQRLREYKEKKENLKREQEANKKPLFKVTHASLEKYNLENVYGGGNSYKFTAPKNIQGISFMVKATESPRKRVTRSAARLQVNVTLKEGVKNQAKTKVSEHVVASTKKIDNEPQKRQTKRIIKNKLPLQSAKSEEVVRDAGTSLKAPIKDSTRIRNAKKVLSVSDVAKETKNVDNTFYGVSVTITNAERMLADANLASNLTQGRRNKTVGEGELHQQGGKSKTPSTVKTNKPKIDKTDEVLSKVAKRLAKTPSKIKSNNPDVVKTQRSLRKAQAEEGTQNVVLNEGLIKYKLRELEDEVEILSLIDKTPKTEPKRPKINLKPKQAEEDLIAKLNKASSKINVETLPARLKTVKVKSSEELSVVCEEKKTPSKTAAKTNPEGSSKKLKTEKSSKLPQRRITRSNSQSTPLKNEAVQINTQESTDNTTTSLIDVNIENNINEANVELTASLKTPENTEKTPNSNCVYVSPFVTVSRGKDSARKEYAQRKISGGTFNSPSLQQNTNVQTAAEYFTLLLDRETNKINNNCEYWNTFKNDSNLPEEAVDMIDVAIGQGTLLRNKKMQSFRNLIQYSLEEQTDKPVTCMDLHGYWDVLNMQIDNVSTRFENLSKIRDNNWKEILPERPKKVVTKKPVAKKPLVISKRSNALLDAIKSRRLNAILSKENVTTKPPKSDRNSVSSAKGSNKRVSSLSLTPNNAALSPKSSSPHIMMQISQIAKSVERLGSEAVLSATKSILKKRQNFKINGRKPKVVLFDVSDDVSDDEDVTASNNNEKETHILRRSTRLQ